MEDKLIKATIDHLMRYASFLYQIIMEDKLIKATIDHLMRYASYPQKYPQHEPLHPLS
uniref:Uncharacterized protein n=1 Tax=Pithovirus LCPAC403 TaxID=2506596 RepID=A0A481ZBX3_9VIRU|nr:MAG: hypothetical protein LCPAC403_01190 [Pithovirus LCPAC403]